eukprot:COSAG06_NODE_4587_length_4122_cov_2.670147_3_plen_65_part_00
MLGVYRLPALLYRKLKASFAKGRLDHPDFRARYGYLISRFKPGKWGSEFRGRRSYTTAGHTRRV